MLQCLIMTKVTKKIYYLTKKCLHNIYKILKKKNHQHIQNLETQQLKV